MRRLLLEDWEDKEIPWFCTSCGACTIRCPRDIKPSEVVIGLRARMVEEGIVPASLTRSLENTLVQKNPWGKSKNKRASWTEDLDFEVPLLSSENLDTLMFSCCIQAFDPRCTVVPQNMATILHDTQEPFGILGKKEVCCGNEIRRMGENGLFQELQEENERKFKRQKIKKIIALSPHCLNAFKKEYDDEEREVFHYSQFLLNLIEEKRLAFKGSYDKKVIYHDPCFLGKQNNIFDEPRDVLKTVPGVELLEFWRSRENSLCCEGGGGRMFVDVEEKERSAEQRVEEAVSLGAEVIATACPFCLVNLEDAAVALESGIEVKEIAEIIMEAL